MLKKVILSLLNAFFNAIKSKKTVFNPHPPYGHLLPTREKEFIFFLLKVLLYLQSNCKHMLLKSVNYLLGLIRTQRVTQLIPSPVPGEGAR